MFPTIQMADLQQLVRTDQIRWFDCRYDLQQPEYGRNAFLEQHVEGAQHLDLTIDLSGPLEEVGGRHPLPSKEAWQHTLEQHGVTPEDFVVLYDDGFPYAARAWWLFKWIGHERVVVLEGGFSSYLAFDLPVTDHVPTYPPSHYSPRFQDEMLVSFDDLKDQLTETMVIDSRAPDRYRGEIEPLDHVAGHIPGAVNCYFEQALSPEGRLRDAEDLKELYADILPVTAPILYCGSGVTACVNVIALHSLGKTDVRLYAGSYSDWVSRGEDVSRS